MDRKSRGQCFRCGEKYHPLHQCVDRQLRIVILGDDEQVNEEGEVVAIEVEEDLTSDPLECKAIRLFGIFHEELSGVKTMRLEGWVNGIPVVVLVDSGASHNFISPKVVSALGLSINESHKMGVRLGDGHRIFTKGRCSGIQLRLNDSEFSIDAYVMELRGMDIILGVVWLETLGKVIMD